MLQPHKTFSIDHTNDLLFIFLTLLMFIYFWETERDRVGVGEGQRERETQNPKQAPRLWAISTEPDTGLKPMNCKIMTWAKVGRLTNWSTQAPHINDLLNIQIKLCHYSALNTYWLPITLRIRSQFPSSPIWMSLLPSHFLTLTALGSYCLSFVPQMLQTLSNLTSVA